MRLLRSSYGLLGVLVEVTLRVKPMTAVYARHRTYTIDAFRAAVPDLVAQGNALMMYFYPFCEKVTGRGAPRAARRQADVVRPLVAAQCLLAQPRARCSRS